MRAFTLLFSLAASRPALQASSLQSGYTEETNATVCPSGDHSSLSAPVEIEVRRVASPPSSAIQYICGVPARPEINANFFPSGDHRGRVSLPPRVNCRAAPPPAAGTTQISPTERFASRSGVATL